jgi:glutathione S-transferase
VLDMTTVDAATYADNPTLKVPILVDAQGPLYGTENICRELARRSGRRDRVVLRGDVADRAVANAEELILHAMATVVTLIVTEQATPPLAPPPKARPSLQYALAFLETHVDRMLAALPPERLLSFCETALYCLVAHLPFRKVMEVGAYPRLQGFCAAFGDRPAARATAYRFDTA